MGYRLPTNTHWVRIDIRGDRCMPFYLSIHEKDTVQEVKAQIKKHVEIVCGHKLEFGISTQHGGQMEDINISRSCWDILKWHTDTVLGQKPIIYVTIK
jgi:hypothetical protein